MTFKLGDRVMVHGHQDGMDFDDDVGIVIRFDTYVGVQFENPVAIERRNGTGDCLHSSQDNGRPGACWNFDLMDGDPYNNAIVTFMGKRERKKSGFGQFVERHSL